MSTDNVFRMNATVTVALLCTMPSTGMNLACVSNLALPSLPSFPSTDLQPWWVVRENFLAWPHNHTSTSWHLAFAAAPEASPEQLLSSTTALP